MSVKKYYLIVLAIIVVIFSLLFLAGCSIKKDDKSESSFLKPYILGDLATREEKINNIAPTLEVDGDLKWLLFTDDNTDENFIIKSDSSDYYILGGNAYYAYFSITNVSGVNQSAYVSFAFSDKQSLLEVESFFKNDEVIEEIVIPATATSSEQRISKKTTNTIWDKVGLTKMNPSDNINRKSIKDRKMDRGFVDIFGDAETKFYRAKIAFTPSTEGDEWFIEVFGNNGNDYGHLDPDGWLYEQNFDSMNPANIVGQDSWAQLGTYDSAVVINTLSYDGQNSLEVGHSATAGQAAYRNVTTVTGAGTWYFALRFNHSQASGQYAAFRLGNTGMAEAVIYYGADDDSNFYQAYSGGAEDLFAISTDTWYVIECNFDDDESEFYTRYHNGTSWSEASATRAYYQDYDIQAISFSYYNQSDGDDYYIDTVTGTNPIAEASTAEANQDIIIFE